MMSSPVEMFYAITVSDNHRGQHYAIQSKGRCKIFATCVVGDTEIDQTSW